MLELAIQIADPLEAAHSEGMILFVTHLVPEAESPPCSKECEPLLRS